MEALDEEDFVARGRVSSILGIIASLAFVALGVGAILFMLSYERPSAPADQTPDGPAPIEERTFSEFSWTEIAGIAKEMEQAPDDAAALAIAAGYGLVDEAGAITAQTHQLVLDNGTMCDVRIVGILHDTLSGSGKKAALTFLASPIDMRPINETASSAGGWKESAIRSWLASEGLALFPDELASSVASVQKLTNNSGKSAGDDAISATDDKLWLFSCKEVCGSISWLEDEFGYLSDGADWLLNAEGEQYAGFSSAGVTQHSDASSYLQMLYQGSPVAWWYRTPYSFEYMATTEDTFYQVTSSGFASGVNLANEPAGIVVGFCL